MDLRYSNFKRFWEAYAHPQPANMLKFLDLSYSFYLKETPDLSYLPNLEKLLLINCKGLVLVHKSIGILHKKLRMSDCSELQSMLSLPKRLLYFNAEKCISLEKNSRFF